jgi:ribosome recycling factor
MAFFGHLPLRALSRGYLISRTPSFYSGTLPGLVLIAAPNFHLIRGKKTRREPVPESEEGSQIGSRGGKLRSSMAPVEEDAPSWVTLLEQTERKMRLAIDHYGKELGTLETRASGRVNPSLLDPIRIPSMDGRGKLKLNAVATVGVKEGHTLVITLFDDKVSQYIAVLPSLQL